MIAFAGNLALVAVSAGGAWAIGRWIAGRWRFGHPALQVAAESAVGLLALSHLLLLLIEVGAVTRLALHGVLGLLALALVVEVARVDRAGAAAALSRWRPRSPTDWIGAAGALAYGAWMLLLSTLPPLGYDSLVYHLEIPRQILAQGGRVHLPDNIYAFFPQLGENLFLIGLGLAGEPAAKLFHAVFGVLLGAAIYGYSRRHLDRGPALLAAAVFLTVPTVMQGFTWAYVDLTFTLYAFLALVAALRFLETRATTWAVAAGVMAGGAWATKFTGLQLVLLLGLVVLVGHLLERRRTIPWSAAWIVLVAALIFLPYPLRNLGVTGWPLYPFDLGGGEIDATLNWDVERSGLYRQFLDAYGVRGDETRTLDRLAAPVKVFLTARFWSYEAYDGMIGPAFLLVPLLLVGTRPPRELRLMGLFALAYLYFWSVTTLQARFLLPVLAPASVLLAWALARQRARLVWTVIVLVLVGLNVRAGVLENVSSAWNGRDRPWAYWAGDESREEFLTARVTNYAIYQDANRLLGPDDVVYLADMQHLGYYLDCAWRADFVFERWTLTRILEASTSAADAARRFREAGITHLMMNESVILAETALSAENMARLRAFLTERTEVLAVRRPARQLHTLRRIATP